MNFNSPIFHIASGLLALKTMDFSSLSLSLSLSLETLRLRAVVARKYPPIYMLLCACRGA